MKTLLQLATLALTLTAGAQTVTNTPLEWDYPHEFRPDTFRLYHGVKPGIYTNFVNVSGALLYCDVQLPTGVTNYLAATARLNGIESDRSNELVLFYPAPVGKPPAPVTLRLRVPLFGR